VSCETETLVVAVVVSVRCSLSTLSGESQGENGIPQRGKWHDLRKNEIVVIINATDFIQEQRQSINSNQAMAAPLLETPSRVLRRVMEAEDVELPSLPSIVDHFDETSDDGMYTRDDSEQYIQQTPAKYSAVSEQYSPCAKTDFKAATQSPARDFDTTRRHNLILAQQFRSVVSPS
jgi:hypothetical protein